MSKRTIRFLRLTLTILAFPFITAPALACLPGMPLAPTSTATTQIRQGPGEFGAPRGGGKKHAGVDLVINGTYKTASSYAVRPFAPGVVAYARLNGGPTSGYGNLIAIDHGNGCYSVYAHLANLPFTTATPGGNLLVTVGQTVTATTVIGYITNLTGDVDSTGNAQKLDPIFRQQVHVALYSAPSGRRSQAALSDVIGTTPNVIDPSPFLKRLGYAVR